MLHSFTINLIQNNLVGSQSWMVYLLVLFFLINNRKYHLSFSYINVEEATWLEKAFEESEVVEAVRALNGDQTLMVSQWLFFFFFHTFRKEGT
jgi:hypothetical protein